MIPRNKILFFLYRYGNIKDKNNAEALFYQLNCNIENFYVLLKDLEQKKIITLNNFHVSPEIMREYFFPESLYHTEISFTEKGKYLTETFLIGHKKTIDNGINDLDYIQIDNVGFNLSEFKNCSYEDFYKKYRGNLQRDSRIVYWILTGKQHQTERLKIFISYSWDSDKHKKWVLSFAKKIKEKGGFEIILDQIDFKSGMHTWETMKKSIISADKVIIILTEKYKSKAENNHGGVGYEFSIIKQDLFKLISNEKYIPILKDGNRESSTPVYINDYFNFNDARKKLNYNKLINEIKSNNIY